MRQDVVEDGHDPRREQKASPVFPKDARQDPKDPNLLFLASLGLLRAVHLDHVLLRDLLVDQELRDEFPLVALELNDVAELGVIYDGAVAVELLLALLEDHLLVDLGVDSLPSDEKIGQDVRRAGRGCARVSRATLVSRIYAVSWIWGCLQGRTWMVVKDLRPLRCWERMWM